MIIILLYNDLSTQCLDLHPRYVLFYETLMQAQSRRKIGNAHSRKTALTGAFMLLGNRRFLGAWLLTTASALSVLYAVNLVPNAIAEAGDAITAFLIGDATPRRVIPVSADAPTAEAMVMQTEPRLIIPVIGVNSGVVRPANRSIEILNQALLKGVVHYPGSALPNEDGNVFFFGHSTGLKVVHNKAFEVFNRISELKAGDVVRVRYGSREYWYRVTSLAIGKVDETKIDLAATGRKLTLVTCRVFGAKEDRYIVEADFVKSYPLRSI